MLKGFYISLNCLPEIECSKLLRFTTNEAIVRSDNSELCIEISGDDEKFEQKIKLHVISMDVCSTIRFTRINISYVI